MFLYFPAVCKVNINTNQNKTDLLGVKLSLQHNSPKSISSNAALAPSTRIFFGEPWRASYIKYTPSRTMGLIFSAYPCKLSTKCQLLQTISGSREHCVHFWKTKHRDKSKLSALITVFFWKKPKTLAYTPCNLLNHSHKKTWLIMALECHNFCIISVHRDVVHLLNFVAIVFR